MKLSQFLGVLVLAAVSFMAGGSYESSIIWTHAASAGLGMLVGAAALALFVALHPEEHHPRRARSHDRPLRRLTLGHTLVGGRYPALRPRG